MTPKQTASGRTAGRRRHEHGVLQQRAPMSIRSMTGEDLCTEVSTEKSSWEKSISARKLEVGLFLQI